MPLDCPRCSTPLAPNEVDRAVTVDVCDRCHGVWIDGDELMTACRTLAHLPDRRGEVELTGRPAAGIARCPRCGGVPHELHLVGADVDFCTRCAGAWIDGDEREPLGVGVEPRKPRGGPGGAYRQVVDESVAVDAIPCVRCGEKVRIRTTFVSADGFICGTCHVDDEIAETNRRIAAAHPGSARAPSPDEPLALRLGRVVRRVIDALGAPRAS